MFKVDSPIRQIQESICSVLHGAQRRLSSPPRNTTESKHYRHAHAARGITRPAHGPASHAVGGKAQPRNRTAASDGERWREEREKARLEIWAAGELSEAHGRLQSELHRRVLRLIHERDEAKEKAATLKGELIRARDEIEARIKAVEEQERQVDSCYEECYEEAATSYHKMIDQVRSSLEVEAHTRLQKAASISKRT